MPRMQSPSSINMYKQCPRKYYYRYIKRLPTKPSIHLVRGTITHEVLEYFFESTPLLANNWQVTLQQRMFNLFKQSWDKHEDALNKLEETPEELSFYREETARMLINYLQYFTEEMKKQISRGLSPQEAFTFLRPKREVEYVDDELQVRGFIDCVEEFDEKVFLIDYKTSKKPEITPDYRLQLGIYALLYLRAHQKIPDGVGVHFLRHDKQLMEVNDGLLLDAQFEIEQIHFLTKEDDICYYPKKPSPLCNWCDYYEQCYGSKKS